MAGNKLIWICFFLMFNQLLWAQEPTIEIKHTVFNAVEGTIDLICKPYDNEWIQYVMVNKSECNVTIQQSGLEGGKEIALKTKSIIPIQFYGSDFQPDPIPPPSIAILWDLGIHRQKHALKKSEKVLTRLLSSQILGYSQVHLFAFDTVMRYDIDFQDDPLQTLLTEIRNNDTIASLTNWPLSISSQTINNYDILVLITDGAKDTSANELLVDSTFSHFFTQPWMAEKQIFIVGAGDKIDSTAFTKINNFTLTEDSWTMDGRIPLGLAQSQSVLPQNAEGYVVIQCLPDAMENLDEKAFSFSPIAVDLLFNDQKYASAQTTVGSFLRPRNLMHESQGFSGFIFLIMLALAILTIIIFLVPMRHRYKFKRDHVFVYKQIKDENDMALDPMTLVPIEEDDVVVRMDDRIMTIKTWQSLKKKPTHPAYEDHIDFFDPKYSGHLFGLQIYGNHPVQIAWFGMAGGAFTWFLNECGIIAPFSIISQIEMLLTNLESSNTLLLLPKVIWESAAITIGIFCIPVFFRNKMYDDHKRPLLVLLIVFSGYILSTLFINYLQTNEWIGAGVFWSIMGLTLTIGLSIIFRKKFVHFLPDALILAVSGYLFFQLIGHFLLMNIWGIDLRLANLFSFILFGWLFGQLSAAEIHTESVSVANETSGVIIEENQNIETTSSIEV